MNLLWSITNTLQLISCYPLIEVAFSSNSLNTFYTIHKLVTFDFLPESRKDIIAREGFKLQSDILFNQRYSVLGYKMPHILASLSPQFIIVALVTLYFLAQLLRYKMSKTGSTGEQKASLQLKQALFTYCSLFMELCLPFALQALPESFMK